MPAPPDWKRKALLLRARYSAGLISAYGVGAIELFLVVLLLNRGSDPVSNNLLTLRNVGVGLAMLAASLALAAVCTSKFVVPALHWYSRREAPTPEQRRAALDMTSRQTTIHVAMWLVGGGVFLVANVGNGGRALAVITIGVVFGGALLACLGYLVSEATLRPIVAAAMVGEPAYRRAPSVMERLVYTWALCTALPVLGIGAIIVDTGYTHWVLRPDTPIELPILILAGTAIGAGLRGTILASRAVSDPVREVGLAMREVEHGRTDVVVSVHDSSEIGRLQMGFNSMVDGIAERERVRELFGRHVGRDVASRAIAQDAERLGGDVRTAAVLFIDLAGSTAFAATRPPTEVAELLNEFFHIVVTAVDQHDGFVNKFTGDAALAIYGVPVSIDDPAGAALATARELRKALEALESVDFGIGVSYGSVFAGDIGAELRYEYTVIGDPVNEAARLTELAKSRPGRVLASAQAIDHAAEVEAAHWRTRGRTRLRGRVSRTVLAEPR